MKIGFDVDGVICQKPVVKTPEDCLNAERTEIEIPSDRHEVYLVSVRSEKLREETEEWLAKNMIEYEELVLYDGEGLEDRSRWEIDMLQSKFKSNVINNLGLEVFVEDRIGVRRKLRDRCPDCTVLPPKRAWELELV